MKAVGYLAAAILMLPVARAAGQQPAGSCRVENGLAAAFSWGDSAGVPTARDSASRGLRLDARTTVDTVWRFDIAERRWTKPYFVGWVGAGWSGGGSATGTTTAPGSSNARSWSACANVAIEMRDPTLVLRGARGTVRLRADVSSLSRAGRGARADTAGQPRR
jgi:hypothetical protein